jgi:hypothetical protein|tara:strand:+ start:3304 stop:3741 length:438 start_codon:yes stop_codon:yes gene_type:complete
MKRFNVIDIIILMVITAAVVIILNGCATTPLALKPAETCEERLSSRDQEMIKFARYCKVAVFAGRNSGGDKKLKNISDKVVKICKFVYDVDTEQDLALLMNPPAGGNYHTVRYYIQKEDNIHEGPPIGWRTPLPCDPMEPTCEEF